MTALETAVAALRTDLTAEITAAVDARAAAEKRVTRLQDLAAQVDAIATLASATTPTVPGGIPDGADTVRVGASCYPLAAVNPTQDNNPAGFLGKGWNGRGEQQLVLCRTPWTRTDFNQYGAVVSVVRGVAQSAPVLHNGVMDVPVDGYALAGHGNAATWMLQNITKGTVVEVIRTVPAPTSTGRACIMWHDGWSGQNITAYPITVVSGLTAVALAMCQSAGEGTGKIGGPPGVTPGQIADLTTDGTSRAPRPVDVFAGIGGANDGGITILTSAQVAEAVTSIVEMQAEYGITGIVLDLEGAPGQGWTPDTMISLGRACISRGLKVAIWSALYEGRLEAWGQVARALGSDLAWWERGFYDFPEARDDRLVEVVTGDLAAMRSYVARDDQLVCSFAPMRPGMVNSTPIPVIAGAYRAAREGAWCGRDAQAGPVPVGWSVWHDGQEAVSGWLAARTLLAG